MSVQVISQGKSRKSMWKEIGSVQNINIQQAVKRKGSKSKFCTSQPKSPQSAMTKQLKFPTQFAQSFIKEMSRQQGYLGQAKSEIGANDGNSSLIHDSQQQKFQPGKNIQQHQRVASSSMINIPANSKVTKKNEQIQSYQTLIVNLQKQFTNFQKQILKQLKDLQSYYTKMINKLEVRYMEQIDRLQMEINLSSQNIPYLNQAKSLEIQPNPEKFQRKITRSKLSPTKSTSPRQLKTGNKRQNVPSLSDLATGLQKQQFKKFAETFQKMKLEMDQEIPIGLQIKQSKSGVIRRKI